MKFASELLSIRETLTDWSEVEYRLQNKLGARNVFIGGDALRPYLYFDSGNGVEIEYLFYPGLPNPPFINFLSLNYECAKSDDGQFMCFFIDREAAQDICNCMDNIPEVLLVGLGLSSAYPFVRLNLGVSRLSQWLRFCGIARVDVLDFFLVSDPVEQFKKKLMDKKFDVVGTSVNFGQWSQLEEVSELLQSLSGVQLVFGNILTSFSSSLIRQMFSYQDVTIALGLGEGLLKDVCQNSIRKKGTEFIAGVPSYWFESIEINDNAHVICPDDRLVNETLESGGQLSLETSLGCQYGLCTFCPREHRGNWWQRGYVEESTAIIERYSRIIKLKGDTPYVSFVDEEFFGNEEVQVKTELSPHQRIINQCSESEMDFELYTRIDNLFSRKKSLQWNLDRCGILTQHTHLIRRVFCGIESGCVSQLKRYGKGQKVEEIVDAIRVASMIGIPLQFGFITFDPLMSIEELVENINFLGRRDILCDSMIRDNSGHRQLVTNYYKNLSYTSGNEPLYTQVSYLATELEVLLNSSYSRLVQRKCPELLSGKTDPNFARYECGYADNIVEEVVRSCRVWTQNTFPEIYRAKLVTRSESPERAREAKLLFMKYQTATYSLMTAETAVLLNDFSLLANSGDPLCEEIAGRLKDNNKQQAYNTLWEYVFSHSNTHENPTKNWISNCKPRKV